jgi:isopenicillin N synthase-like dioxygenase
LFRDAWQQLTEISIGCDEACLTLLKNLSKDLLVHHRPNQPSDTGLKMVLYPSVAKLSDLPDSTHTDDGTLTLLFYKDWSVHSFIPDANTWAYLPPPPDGCALINVANALQKLSGGRLHSPKHGVTQPFDGAKNRYYLSYFLRPETVLIEKWNAAG